MTDILKCSDCGIKIEFGVGGVCPVCKAELCYNCFQLNHKDRCSNPANDPCNWPENIR